MRILSLDTSSERIVMGYVDEERGISSDLNVTSKDKHSVVLMDIVDSFLKAMNVKLEDVDLFGCGMGPGFFTALRVGIATVKSFAFVLKKKIIGVPSTDLIAMNLPMDGKILVVVYARRDHFYVSLYERKDGTIKRLTPHHFHDRIRLIRYIDDLSNEGNIYLSGSGIPHVMDELKSREKVKILDESAWYGNGMNLNKLVLMYHESGENLYDALSFLPLYVQKPFVILKDEGEVEV